MSEAFWDFSIRTYRSDGVPEACLHLQDERGVDVNMLLFCCWFGLTRGQQQAESFQQVLGFSDNWAQQVVRPLRKVRTWMKLDGCHHPRMDTESCMDFREKVKGIELSAEKMQQHVLESIIASIPARVSTSTEQLEAVVGNINQYFSSANIDIDELDKERLLTIILAGVPVFSADDIHKALT